MPTVFTHAAVAVGLARLLPLDRVPARFWWLTVLCAVLPDFDAITFRLGIPYASLWGHRGITHSLAFAAVVGLVVAGLAQPLPGRPRWQPAAWLAFATATHPLLDMLTNGGLGVALLAPLSNERYFLPWRPVRVSPVGAGFFSLRGLATLLSELQWLILPLVLMLGTSRLRRRPQPPKP
ncbi:metal-dependent hydrolase [Hymenobacter sp. B81]|uniref:metal-dependent hydrolase n=1 Tax=Hymenobacter sp. B81 TaxID=3344878 RepID=UPI0037DD3EDF